MGIGDELESRCDATVEESGGESAVDWQLRRRELFQACQFRCGIVAAACMDVLTR